MADSNITMQQVRSCKMEYTYELLETQFGSVILRSYGACIPTDPANSDYQAYLDRDKPKAALSTPNV